MNVMVSDASIRVERGSDERSHPGPTATNQRGLVLITVVLLLVVIAAIGAASMRSAGVQERLAGVFYDRAVALASSESALSDGKEYVLRPDFEATSAASKVRDGTTLYGSGAADGLTVSSWVAANTSWTSGSVLSLGAVDGIADSLARVATPPAYIIDRMPDMGVSTTTKFQTFRITARGAGGRSENAVYTHALTRIPVSTGS